MITLLYFLKTHFAHISSDLKTFLPRPLNIQCAADQWMSSLLVKSFTPCRTMPYLLHLFPSLHAFLKKLA